MAQVDWQNILSGNAQPKKRYSGANVKFLNVYNENRDKSLAAGRPVFDEVPSISIQWPGMDETVRRIEPRDIEEYPEKYQAFMRGNEPVESGTPLAEWPLMSGAAMRELQYLGFKTVEQLAEANDDVKRRLGPLAKFIKLAKEWLDASNSTQADVVKLKQQLEKEQSRTAKLEERLELLMQRVEASEGTSLTPMRKEVIQESTYEDTLEEEDVSDETPKKRGRPRKS
jgi:hypothetical protein